MWRSRAYCHKKSRLFLPEFSIQVYVSSSEARMKARERNRSGEREKEEEEREGAFGEAK